MRSRDTGCESVEGVAARAGQGSRIVRSTRRHSAKAWIDKWQVRTPLRSLGRMRNRGLSHSCDLGEWQLPWSFTCRACRACQRPNKFLTMAVAVQRQRIARRLDHVTFYPIVRPRQQPSTEEGYHVRIHEGDTGAKVTAFCSIHARTLVRKQQGSGRCLRRYSGDSHRVTTRRCRGRLRLEK